MSRFRSMLGRIAKPLAMVGIVGTLATMMIVTTPSTAHALKVRDIKAAETFVMGATKTLAPVAQAALVAGSFTPVGLGVRLLQLGMIAYSTSDIWMPIVAGAFGQAQPGQTVPSGNALVNQNFEITNLTQTSTGFTFTVKNTGPDSSITTGSAIQCKNTSTGAIGAANATEHGAYIWNGNSTTFTRTCGAGFEPVAGAAYPRCGFDVPGLTPCSAQATVAGPKNIKVFGTWSTAQPGFDPYGADVKYKVKSECIDASGTIHTIEAESSGDYVKFPSCEAAGKGHGTGKNSITGLAPGTTVEQPLWDSPAAPSDPATPLCDAARPTGGCVMSIELDGKPCSPADIECQNWAELEKTTPNNSRLKCKLGPYTLPTASCALLEKAYWPGGAPATEENIDGDPDTKNWLDPSGTPLAPQTPTQTGTAPVPGGSGQTNPDADPESVSCFPAGFAAFNPVEWVLQPIRCAFTPKPNTQTQFVTRLQTRIATVGFAPMATAWLAAYQDVGGGSGCSGPTVNFQMNGVSQSLQPFQACTEPMSTVAAISNGVATVGIVLFGGLAMVRAIGSAFGINFSMGGKSDGD